MMIETKALHLLRERTKGETQEEIRKRLSCSQQAVSLILNGRRRPGLQLGSAIEREYQIEVAWWQTPDEGGPPIERPRVVLGRTRGRRPGREARA